MERFLEIAAHIRTLAYTMLLSSAFHAFGKRSVIVPPLRFHNLRGIAVGSRVHIHGFCWIQALEPDDGREYPFLVIEDHANIGMGATISAAKKIIIGEHALLGRNVHISDHGHDFHDITRPIDMQDIRKATEVRIGAESWIGQNAVVLPGATIGRHCVIGANSVVRTPIPDYCVAAGIPARVIKRYDAQAGCWKDAPAP